MTKTRAILTLIVTLSFVISPVLTDPFSGFRADQLPVPQIDPPVQPAGYAFAIWGLIYVWLVISAIFGILKRPDDPAWDNARNFLIVSLAVGTPWLAVANASAIWATVLIFVMLITAIAALLSAPKDTPWAFTIPVGLYAGWLTAASFVSLATTAAGYDILTDQLWWAYAGILGALVVSVAIQRASRAPSYGLAVAWALVGIVVANGADQITISALATVGAVGLLVLTGRSALS